MMQVQLLGLGQNGEPTPATQREVKYVERGPGIAWVIMVGLLGLSIGYGVGFDRGISRK